MIIETSFGGRGSMESVITAPWARVGTNIRKQRAVGGGGGFYLDLSIETAKGITVRPIVFLTEDDERIFSLGVRKNILLGFGGDD